MNENGERRLNPNQLRPTDLPRGFQVEPAQVVSPMPDAGRSSGSRALRLSPGSYYPPLPSSKELVHVVDSCSLNAAGVAPGSLLLSDNAQRTSMGLSLLRLSIFVNSDMRVTARYGFISTMSHADERKSPLSLPGPTPQVQANTCPLRYVVPEDRTD